MKSNVPLLLLARLFVSSLHAMDVKHYRDLLEKLKTDAQSRTLTSNQTLFFGYFTGLGEGLGLANATLLITGKPMLFCAPSDLELTPDDYADLVDQACLLASMCSSIPGNGRRGRRRRCVPRRRCLFTSPAPCSAIFTHV